MLGVSSTDLVLYSVMKIVILIMIEIEEVRIVRGHSNICKNHPFLPPSALVAQ